ncbi:miles to go [Musca autumnalis]|uniref:miles to go n=1 Tax=Musca autumnalis TaxID=221902 RepID=UPI003CF431B0
MKTLQHNATIENNKLSKTTKRQDTIKQIPSLSINAKEFKPLPKRDDTMSAIDYTAKCGVESNSLPNTSKNSLENVLQEKPKPIRIMKRGVDKLTISREKLGNSKLGESKENFAQTEIDLIKSLCDDAGTENHNETISSDNMGEEINGIDGHAIETEEANDGCVNCVNGLEASSNAIAVNKCIRNSCDTNCNVIDKSNELCNDNCLCFCPTTTAGGILSVSENGYGQEKQIDNNGDTDNNFDNNENAADDDNEIVDDDDRDLPNYSQSCIYEQRIIDFENFRIIEQVIDSNCNGNHGSEEGDKCCSSFGTNPKSTNTYESSDKWEEIFKILPESLKVQRNIPEQAAPSSTSSSDSKPKPLKRIASNLSDNSVVKSSSTGKHPIYTNPSINFSCSELVAFIGDSFKVIDNAQAVYKSDPREIKEFVPRQMARTKSKESCSVGNSPFRRGKRGTPCSSSSITATRQLANGPHGRTVDDNNNTRRFNGLSAADRLMQSLNCDVSRELHTKKDRRDGKSKNGHRGHMTNEKPTTAAGTTNKTLLKALKSKLTPLAPPFQPSSATKAQIEAAIIANTHGESLTNGTAAAAGANSCPSPSNSSTYLNYEQTTTTIYYQQQNQAPQQQQPQQQLMASNMLLNFPPSNTNLQQQQLVSQQQHQPAQLFIPSPHHQHQQHCAQNILAMMGQGGIPHIHLATTGATSSNNGSNSTTVLNLTSNPSNANTTPPHHTHLLPIQLISTMGGGEITAWPLVDATTAAAAASATTATGLAQIPAPSVYMDLNGELHSICPAHGPPPSAIALSTTASNGTNYHQALATTGNQTASVTAGGASSLSLATPAGIANSYNSLQYSAPAYHHHQHPQQQQQHSHQHLLALHTAAAQHYQQSTPTPLGTQAPPPQTLALANSPLRIKSNCNFVSAQSSQCSATANSAVAAPAAAQSSSSSSSASVSSPRVVLQLDAGVSLPLQIAGKRKLIQGPTTVQMVSQNRPPPPMTVPVQVPQGQMVQPYVNESGTLTHVVLSPQQYQQLHAGQGHIHPSFIANGTTHYYAPMPNGFQPGTGAAAPYPVNPHGHMAPPHQPPTPQPPPHQQQMVNIANNPTQQSQHSPASHSANHSPSPPNNNNNYHKDERTQRQHKKLIMKLEKQREYNSAVSSPNHSPSPRRQEPQINGHNNNGSLRSQHNNQQTQQRKSHQQRNGSFSSNPNNPINNNNSSSSISCNNQGASSSNASSEEGEDLTNGLTPDNDDEDCQTSIIDHLSDIQKPEVSEITSRSAKIMWDIPQSINESASHVMNLEELRYNVLLSERTKECKFKSFYKGSSYDCVIQDLKPGQDYVVRVQVHYEHLQGNPSEPVEFATPPCEPDRPTAPRLVMFTKNSLHLRWVNANCNGSPLQHYLLEHDDGRTGPLPSGNGAEKSINFVEAVKIKGRQYVVTKLQPSTLYHFRLAAVNEVGSSLYSPICSFSTQGNPPAAPKPPTLQSFSSSSLRLLWERRPADGATCIYILQMLDRESGHGYLNVYNGPDCSYECCKLRRATLYNFRLKAENESGASAWSPEVSYKTAPERPGRPGKPYAKGKIHGTHFRVRWEPPSDNGGADVQRYYLEINAGGQKFERIYSGAECEANCDRLQPGTTYQLRASCEGPGGFSPYSEISHITSEAVVPAAPPAPYYDTPPGPFAAVLRLEKPDYNGGAPILEYEVQIRRPGDQEPPTPAYRGKEDYCVVNALQPGTQYEVQVRALNRIGAGAWSPWFEFSSAAAPPNNPENLKVIVKSATQLHVTWQEPANKGGAPISEYRLESASSPSAKEESSPEPPPASAFHICYQGLQCSTDLRNLLPFTRYYFRVNACNVAGMSKWSPMANCQTPAAAPSPPQIKDFEFTSNEATLRWSAPENNGSPIINYTIEYNSAPSNVTTITTPDDKTEYTVSNLQPETSYKFKVQAINAIGSGPYSAYAKLTTLPSPPTPPKLECSGVGHNFIKLKWGDGKNLDFTKFYVEMYVQRAKEFQVVYTGTNCMCKVNKLQERTCYTFRICAGNDRAGVGEYSDEYVFTTTPCLPSSIKAPRIAQNLNPSALGGATTGTIATVNTTTTTTPPGGGGGNTSTNANVIPSGLIPETPSYPTGLGNLMLGVPLTLEWQHSKNSFSDRVEYMLQYAIGKDGNFKMIYRGSETKFTIENLEPAGLYQFRVCPIRVTSTGEDLFGAFTSPFRYVVPLIPPLEEIDDNLLTNAAATMIASLNAAGANTEGGATCHGHAHNHHSHLHHHHSHHNSRHSDNNLAGAATSSGLHHRSISANSNSSKHQNSNNSSNNVSATGNNTLLIGTNAMGFIPISNVANELAANFSGCDDPNHHHHHHHHHAFHDSSNNGVSNHNSPSGGGSSASNSSSNAQNTATLLAASAANQLFANNPILLQAATAAISHHQHILDNQRHHQQHHGSVLRRFVHRLSSVYTNRKRFSDQEKAVIFMLSFLFFTFVFATFVKMFMR